VQDINMYIKQSSFVDLIVIIYMSYVPTMVCLWVPSHVRTNGVEVICWVPVTTGWAVTCSWV
jgi:hypothetical protein